MRLSKMKKVESARESEILALADLGDKNVTVTVTPNVADPKEFFISMKSSDGRHKGLTICVDDVDLDTTASIIRDFVNKKAESKKVTEGWVSDDSHSIWLNLAYKIQKETGMDVWVNDMGYMEVTGDDGDIYHLTVSWNGDRGIVRIEKNGKKIESVNVDTDSDLAGYFNKQWLGLRVNESVRYTTEAQRKTTQLMNAILEDDLGAVENLIADGVDVNKVTNKGVPIVLAARKGNYDIAKVLLDAGATIQLGRALQYAVQQGTLNLVKLLVNAGANVNEGPQTPLQLACMNNKMDVARFLLSRGADPNATPKSGGKSALVYASEIGSVPMVRMLMNAGADINSTFNDGTTLLHVACGRGKKDLVDFLLKSGADINARTKNGITPIKVADLNHNQELVSYLLKHGSDPIIGK